jgi:hypothetical protein
MKLCMCMNRITQLSCWEHFHLYEQHVVWINFWMKTKEKTSVIHLLVESFMDMNQRL